MKVYLKALTTYSFPNQDEIEISKNIIFFNQFHLRSLKTYSFSNQVILWILL